jgi:arylsulfatase
LKLVISLTAMMTGGHPVRDGLGEVNATVAGEALAASEVTIAEVLSEAGYNSGFIPRFFAVPCPAAT